MIAHECVSIEPTAQYFDGLRPVWKPPHVACVKYNSRKVDLYTFSPNALIKPDGGWSEKNKDGFIADVGDGVHPAFTAIVGHSDNRRDFKELCDALRNAKIETRRKKRRVYIAVETLLSRMCVLAAC